MTTLSIAQQTALSTAKTNNNVMAIVQLWMDRHAQRKQLSQLDDFQLADIGISRDAALSEASLPFWK